MINNRQNGRRRGRGGGQRTPNNIPNAGNRQDNRQRGNAAQLHEKYKALARDAQLSGDRVQTEYYHQFADHYFRVLNEGRARYEEQRRQRDDFMSDEEYEQDDNVSASDGDDGDGRDDQQDSRDTGYRNGDSRRMDGRPPDSRPSESRQMESRPAEARPRRERPQFQPRESEVRESEAPVEERISLDVLPPAISADVAADAPRAPRRRTRRPRAEDGDAEIAPAA